MKGRMNTGMGEITINHRCDRNLCRQCGCGVFWYCRYGCSKYERRSGKTLEERQSENMESMLH